MNKIVLYFTSVLALLGCDTSTYAPLINRSTENVVYAKDNRLYIDSYNVYLDITSTNKDLGHLPTDKTKNSPLQRLVSEDELSQILDDIGNTIYVDADDFSLLKKQPANEINLISCIRWGLDPKEYQEKGYLLSKPSILDDVDYSLNNFSLINENNEVIMLNKNMLTYSQSSLSNQKESDLCQYHIFKYDFFGHKSYTKLNGTVNLHVEYPFSYKEIKLDKEDIGKRISLLDNHFELIALEGNSIHIKVQEVDLNKKIKFAFYDDDIYFDSNLSSLVIPFSVYDAMRKSPGLNYEQFIQHFSAQLSDWENNNDFKEASVIIFHTLETRNVSKVLFYAIDDVIGRDYTIPVNIDIMRQ